MSLIRVAIAPKEPKAYTKLTEKSHAKLYLV